MVFCFPLPYFPLSTSALFFAKYSCTHIVYRRSLVTFYPIDSHAFHSMSIGPSIPDIQHFQNLTLKIQGQGQMTMMLHSYKSRRFHKTSNGINPSSGFRDMRSSKSLSPSAAWFVKFLAKGQAHMGQMGKWPWQCTTTGLDNSTEVRMEKIHEVVTEIWVPQIWQPTARPPKPWRQCPSSPDGWGVKNGIFDIPTKLQTEIKSNSHTW